MNPEQQEQFAALLEHTSLPSIINMAQLVSDRILFIHALEQMVYRKEVGSKIKERTQFHKILLRELWVFGEKYALGASDISLKNVLNSYLKHLERNELTPDIPESASEDARLIPDICLWQSYPTQAERIENLVIEIKRPMKKLGKKELDQIEAYAFAIADDTRFPKENTTWMFILLGQDFDDHVKRKLQDRKAGPGNYYNDSEGHISISIFRWNTVIQENKLRLDFLKKHLEYSLDTNQQSLDYLHNKYANLFDQPLIVPQSKALPVSAQQLFLPYPEDEEI